MSPQYNFIQYNGDKKQQSLIQLKDNDDAWQYGVQLFNGSPDAAEVTATEYANDKITVRVLSKKEMLYKIQSV
jgi:hypothetical protein